ncbi:hypothetical protein Nmel_017182 [Mimus melanotis]
MRHMECATTRISWRRSCYFQGSQRTYLQQTFMEKKHG